uniref:Inositol polyphosphate-related phosphatase domain-containing protein n=1 Tax=Populus trichocarpa TaxID=3694 RepID=A0A2K2BI72_POPTR
MNTQPVRNLIKRKPSRSKIILLTSKDQLLQEAERGQVFDGYCEGTSAFKPTYKNDGGSGNYDTSYKVRIPSYGQTGSCSRFSASLLSHEPADDTHSSAHRPVEISCNSFSSLCHISSFISVSPQMLKFKN